MLAELQRVAASIRNFDVSPPEVHPWVKPLGKGDFLIASLDESGAVRLVEIKGSSETVGISKVQKDNQNAFPVFKLVCPLFKLTADHPLREKLKTKGLSNEDRRQLLANLCEGAEWSSGFKISAKRLEQSRRFAAELRPRFDLHIGDSPALSRLFTALDSHSLQAETALRHITEELLEAVRRGEDGNVAERVLIGAVKKSGEIEEKDVPVILDAWRDPVETFVRIAHAKTAALYHQALLAREQGEPDGTCGLTGNREELEHGNLPSPRLPVLSDTILFSANTDIPCVERYRRSGADAFPIGKRTAQTLNGAALWITNEARKGKTWSTVTRNNNPTQDLVIAYVDSNPELDADLAEMFSAPEQREAVFEAKAESVMQALDAKKLRRSDAVLHTLVLRRISKGQVQVELSRDYGVESIYQAFADWQAAALNAPALSLFMPTGKGKPALLLNQRTPFPSQVVQASKWVWIRDGSQRQSAIGCSLATVYDLYLGDESAARAAATTVLRLMLERSTALLVATGHQLSRYGRRAADLPAAARRDALMAVTILGITLYKLNRRKEEYTNETAFLLGRMLGLSDLLHAQYCRVVRGGDLPPQLLGNQHYAMASDHPRRALKVLGDRLRIYWGWAETVPNQAQDKPDLQKAVNIARWARRQISEISQQVHGTLPERGFNDEGKAEMLLGYLSRSGEKTKEGEQESE